MEEFKTQIEALRGRIVQKETELAQLKNDLNALAEKLNQQSSEKELAQAKLQEEKEAEMKRLADEEAVRLAEIEAANKIAEAQKLEHQNKEEAKKLEQIAASKVQAKEEVVEQEEAIFGEAEHTAILKTIEEMAAPLGLRNAKSPNDKFKEKPSLGEKIALQKLNDIKRAIGLNERFQFANDLFKGDMSAFNKAVDELNHLETEKDAEKLIDEELVIKYGWNDEHASVIAFRTLVSRRFA